MSPAPAETAPASSAGIAGSPPPKSPSNFLESWGPAITLLGVIVALLAIFVNHFNEDVRDLRGQIARLQQQIEAMQPNEVRGAVNSIQIIKEEQDAHRSVLNYYHEYVQLVFYEDCERKGGKANSNQKSCDYASGASQRFVYSLLKDPFAVNPNKGP